DIEYTVVQDITSDMLTKESAFVVELLQENYHQAQIEGIGIVTEKENLFVPLKVALESSMFKKWAEDPAYKKSVFDAKKTLVAFMRHGIHIKGIVFDMLLSSYLLNPSENNHDIPAIANRYGKTNVSSDESVYGKGAKMKVP